MSKFHVFPPIRGPLSNFNSVFFFNKLVTNKLEKFTSEGNLRIVFFSLHKYHLKVQVQVTWLDYWWMDIMMTIEE